MNKAIKLLLYFLVWFFNVVIYACLTPVYMILSGLCNYPKRWFWWVNYSLILFSLFFYIFYEISKDAHADDVQRVLDAYYGAMLLFFLIWAFVGTFILHIFVKIPSPYGKLKSYYRKLYPPKPVINKVKVISKSTEDENLKRIKSRLAPHLQELISK